MTRYIPETSDANGDAVFFQNGHLVHKAASAARSALGLSYASQSEMETGTATDRVVAPGRQHSHPAHAKVVARFNGDGTVALQYDYNVDSITDRGAGLYTVNHDVDFADTNYTSFGTAGGKNTAVVNCPQEGQAKAAGSEPIIAIDAAAGSVVDPTSVQYMAFGDQ